MHNNRKRKWSKTGKIAAVLLLLVACLLLAACAKDNDDQTDAQLEKVVLVLDWTPNVNHSGAYVALAEGYFAEQGLDVEIIQPGNNYALQLLAAGQADYGFSYQEEVTYARVAGMDVVSLAAVIQHNTSCFAALSSAGINSVADFGGKTYGGWGGLVEEGMLTYLLEQAEISEPVQIINLGTADFFAASQTGDIDFSWIFYAVTGIEAELRDIELSTIYLRDLDPTFDYYTPVIAASGQRIAENPDQVERFMAALSQGYQFADENPEQTAAILLEAAPELDAEFVQAGAAWMAGRYQDDAACWGWQQHDVWNNFAQWLFDRGLLEEGFVAEDAFTNDYLPQD